MWRFIDYLRTLGHEYYYLAKKKIEKRKKEKEKGKMRKKKNKRIRILLEVIKVPIHDIAWRVKGSERVQNPRKENSVRNLTNWLLPVKKRLATITLYAVIIYLSEAQANSSQLAGVFENKWEIPEKGIFWRSTIPVQ